MIALGSIRQSIRTPLLLNMSTDTVAVTTPFKAMALKPARKQVKAGQVEKKEAVQTGKEYSKHLPAVSTHWY